MRKRNSSLLLLLALSLIFTAAWGQEVAPAQKPQEAGKRLYQKNCSFCHGEKGEGNGPVADYLYPRPRNFKLATYKFRATASGERPTDEDLFRVVTRGIPGTSMPSWDVLKEEERRQLVQYIKSLSEEPWPKDIPQPIKITKEIRATKEAIGKGKEVYKKAKCWECHGEEGRGDGPSAPTLKDDLGFYIKAFDMTKHWLIKGGNTARDIFIRFSTGVDGTPMPSFGDTFSEEERWHLAHYVKSLQVEPEPSAQVVLRARRLRRDLPLDPKDPEWQRSPSLVVPLTGQVIAKPRWQVPAVDTVIVQALFNEKAVAFLLVWSDPSKDTVHQSGADVKTQEKTGYVKIDPAKGQSEKLRDAIALQFPVRIPEGPDKPYLFRGNPGRPVQIWEWKADWQADSARKSPVEEYNAQGANKPYIAQPAEGQEVQGKGIWEKGQWRVVMHRPLTGKDKATDIAFVAGKLIPFAIQAWDGSNGEKGLLMSLSSWHFLLLTEAKPVTVYLYPLLGVVFAGALELWLVRRLKRKS